MCRISVLAFAALAAGCQTTEQYEREKTAYLNDGYVGRPLSDFMMTNGIVPVNAFNVPGGRVFLFEFPCWSWWHTRPMGQAPGTPQDFIVERVEIRGYCQ